jgi:hypothetical protein
MFCSVAARLGLNIGVRSPILRKMGDLTPKILAGISALANNSQSRKKHEPYAYITDVTQPPVKTGNLCI